MAKSNATKVDRSPFIVRRYRQVADGKYELLDSEVYAPLTPAEKRAGKEPKWERWIERFGHPNAKRPTRRERHPSDWYEPKPREDRQLPVLALGLRRIIREEAGYAVRATISKMVRECHVSNSDADYVSELAFDRCFERYALYDPEKMSLKSFCKTIVRQFRLDYIEFLNAEGRRGDFVRYSIRNHSVSKDLDEGDDEAPVVCDGGIYAKTISADELGDPRSLAGLEFNLAWQDLVDICDWDELICLMMLYCGEPLSEVSKVLQEKDPARYTSVAVVRRECLGSLQMKVIGSGFVPRDESKIIWLKR